MEKEEKEYQKCDCGHIVEIDKKYNWNLCAKCGIKLTTPTSN